MSDCIEIEKKPDGTYEVTECEAKGEMGAGEEAGEKGSSYPNLDAALEAAKGMLIATDQSAANSQMRGEEAGKAWGQPGIAPGMPKGMP